MDEGQDKSSSHHWQMPAWHRSRLFWIILLIIVTALSLLKAYQRAQKQQAANQPTPVVAAKAVRQNVPIYLSALGTVTPTYTVTIKSQVNGQLLQVYFREGQEVKAGDLLAEIDKRPYIAQLMQYEGQLARDQALLANALIDLKRYQQLWKQNSISQQTVATQQSLVAQYRGNIKLDEGLIQSTKVNLIYCRIVAPLNGRIGLRLVDPGNIVQTSDTTGIAVINTVDPMTIIFTLPQQNIPLIQQQLINNKTLLVYAYDRDLTKQLAVGQLLTIDNQIDPTTGTVKLKASFPNSNRQLFPSQFVNVKLWVTTLSQALVIPTAAIQYGTSGPFVYAVTNNKIHLTPIKVDAAFNGYTVILNGLAANQWVVTEGLDRLRDQMPVTITNFTQPYQIQARFNWTLFAMTLRYFLA